MSSRSHPHQAQQAPGAGISDGAAIAILGGLFGLTSWVWLSGQIAAWLASRRWPNVGAGEMGRVMMNIPRHASDPALAWPRGARALMPGPVGFYLVAFTLLGLFGFLFLMGLRVFKGAPSGGDVRDARWATPRDLRPLRVKAATLGRLVLGRTGSALVAAEERQSVLVIGPTQTGKTTGLAIPAILEWDGPVIATSIKSDLLHATIAARQARDGQVWTYDPTISTGRPISTWSPLSACGTWGGAQRVASWLVNAARPHGGGIESPEFWYGTSRKLLAPLLLAAAIADKTMEDVVAWVDTQDEDEPRWILDEAGQAHALRAFEATLNRETKARSGAYTTSENVLAAYQDPGVLASADTCDITPDAFLDGRANTLFVCAPAHEQQRLQPLFSTLVMQMVTAVYERAARTGRPLDRPVLIVLDECANIAPIRELGSIASSGAGQGIQLVTVFQDVAQIQETYGQGPARTIVSNHRARVLLPGIADAETLDYVTRVLGDEPLSQQSTTRGARGDRSLTESVHYRNLVTPSALRQMKTGEALLLYGSLPPAKLTLRPWFKDKLLSGIAAGRYP